MSPVVVPLPGNDHIANRIGALMSLDVSSVSVHRFPDGEARIRISGRGRVDRPSPLPISTT